MSVIVGFIILTAFGIRFVIKKYRRTKGYKKLETTDIPLNDMSYREGSSRLPLAEDDLETRDER